MVQYGLPIPKRCITSLRTDLNIYYGQKLKKSSIGIGPIFRPIFWFFSLVIQAVIKETKKRRFLNSLLFMSYYIIGHAKVFGFETAV